MNEKDRERHTYLDVSRHARRCDGLPELIPPLRVEAVTVTRQRYFFRADRLTASHLHLHECETQDKERGTTQQHMGLKTRAAKITDAEQPTSSSKPPLFSKSNQPNPIKFANLLLTERTTH